MKFICRKGVGYNEKRHFLSHDFVLRERWDAAAIIEKIAFRITKKGYMPTWKSFFFRPFNRALFFGFNTIRVDGGPFVVFFETTLPRIPAERRLLRARQIPSLSSEKCKAIIAISQCAHDLQQNLNLGHRNIEVLHPPQKVLVAPTWVKKFNKMDIVRFFFVGRDFARKGGIEILRALDGLKPSNWQLTIVSNFQIADYATQYTLNEQTSLRKEIEDILKRNRMQIEVYHDLPNEEVLRLMQTSHVGLLPTWHDTYGYSVLEMQASGLPVITTDVRALPEINNPRCGWVLPVGEEFGAKISPLKSKEQRIEFSRSLERQLSETIETVLTMPQADLLALSKAAANRIEREHNPVTHKARLLSIIEEK